MAPKIKTGMDWMIVVIIQVLSLGLLLGWNTTPGNAEIPGTATVAKADELEEVGGIPPGILSGRGELVLADKAAPPGARPPEAPVTNNAKPVGFATNRGAQPIPPAEVH